jgi:hypothetical protein
MKYDIITQWVIVRLIHNIYPFVGLALTLWDEKDHSHNPSQGLPWRWMKKVPPD